jgi:hypothetical protein
VSLLPALVVDRDAGDVVVTCVWTETAHVFHSPARRQLACSRVIFFKQNATTVGDCLLPDLLLAAQTFVSAVALLVLILESAFSWRSMVPSRTGCGTSTPLQPTLVW